MVRGKRHWLGGWGCWSSNPLLLFPDTLMYWLRIPPCMSPLRCRLLVNPEILCVTALWGLKHHFPFFRFAILFVPAVESRGSQSGQSGHSSAGMLSHGGLLNSEFEDMGLHQAKENPEDSGSPQREGFALGQQMNSSSKSKLVLFGVYVV